MSKRKRNPTVKERRRRRRWVQRRGSSIGRGAAVSDASTGGRRPVPDDETEPANRETVDGIIERYQRSPDRVIAMMQDLQEALGYLPERDLRYLSAEIDIPASRIFHVATFYRAFRLAPRGRHEIKLCTGTACHVRGAEGVRDAIVRELGIDEGGTTDDLRFSFETVHCLGCCGLAPVVMVDEDIHGKVGFSLKDVLERYR